MKQTTLSIFVDESGRFQYPDEGSRFYILGMVFHDQSLAIDEQIRALDASEMEIGLEGHCFHAGPLVRKEKGYEFMSRKFRGRIFSRMMAFASKVPFKYHCLCVDKKLIDNLGQIVERLQREPVAIPRARDSPAPKASGCLSAKREPEGPQGVERLRFNLPPPPSPIQTFRRFF